MENPQIETPWWEKILRGEREGMLAETVRQVARLSSLGYEAGVRGREFAYRQGWFRSKRLPRPTICVGNITVGGTGKTPLVIRLARDLQAQGLRPGILLRGYKRRVATKRPVLVRDAKTIHAGVEESGDEAMELASRLPGCSVGVGVDRYATGKYLLERTPVDCFILDDGFQHHRLERDINIVTLDVTDPWGGGALLPAGLLRERPEALRRADAVVLTRTAFLGPDRLSILKAQVGMLMRPSSGLLESRYEPRELVGLQPGRTLPPESLRGRRVVTVSGIGNPRSFEAAVTQLGAQVAETLRLADHAGEAQDVWGWLRGRQDSVDFVVMTEKDAMRWQGSSVPADLQGKAFALRMDLVISAGLEHWGNLIRLISELAHVR